MASGSGASSTRRARSAGPRPKRARRGPPTHSGQTLTASLSLHTTGSMRRENTTHPRYMPNLNNLIRLPGVEFENYFVSTPVCCPSRTNLWRGQFSHNTNFTDVLAPHGGYQKWKALGMDKSYLPLWLQQAGYETYLCGKFIVDYDVNNYMNPPAGWTDFDALVIPYTYDYMCPGFSRNGAQPNIYPSQYVTDVLASKAVAQIKTAVAGGKPFYLQVNPPNPHTSAHVTVANGQRVVRLYPPLPAPRHWELFSDANLEGGTPQRNLWEKDVSDKPAWIRALPLAQQSNRTYLQEVYRLRLRSMASVDELIGAVIKQLNDSGVLNNTYVMYTSDNGYHVGTHRMGAGKVLGYEEDIRVPFVIRGPGIKPSNSSKPANKKIGLHVDIAPTILTLAGVDLAGKGIDGTPLALGDHDNGKLPADYPRPKNHRNQFPVEFWGNWQDELLNHLDVYANNTYKAVRVYDESSGRQWKLIYSCTGERELYDLRSDPGELRNVYAYGSRAVKSRLEGLLAVLAACTGETCVNPWKVLHPDGSVSSWSQALDRKYDAVYKAIQPFTFKECVDHYDVDNEVTQFRARRRTAMEQQGDVGASVFSAADTAAAAVGATGHAQGGAARQRVVFAADLERYAQPVPPHVMEANMAEIFTRDLSLQLA